MSTYIKSFSNASDMRTYLDTAPGMKYYLFKNESGEAGIGNTPESGKSIVSLFKGRDYLTFTAQEDGSKVAFTDRTDWNSIEYSLDGGTTWTAVTSSNDIVLNTGDSVKYRGQVKSSRSYSQYSAFAITGKVAASGSIMSIYNNNPNDTVISYQNTFKNLFKGATGLTQAPELPATEVAYDAYSSLFENCTGLVRGPEILPAPTGVFYAGNMFKGCSSLIYAPEIMWTSNASGNTILGNMFYGCTSLSYVKIHITNWSASNAYEWLGNVAATGVIECPTASTIPSDSTNGIPTGWTRVNF